MGGQQHTPNGIPKRTRSGTIAGVPMRTIPVRLEQELIDVIDVIANEDDRPRSTMIRRLILEAVAARQQEDGQQTGPS